MKPMAAKRLAITIPFNSSFISIASFKIEIIQYTAGFYSRKSVRFTPESSRGESNSNYYNLNYHRWLQVIEMNEKTLSTAILVIGIVILGVSMFADSIGIGDNPGFGRDQVIGSVVGAIVTAVGLFLTVKAK